MAKMTLSCIAFAGLLCVSSLLFASEQPIELDTETGGIKGTLTTPAGASKTPVVVIISGSGPRDRDGNTPAPSGGSAATASVLAAALLAKASPRCAMTNVELQAASRRPGRNQISELKTTFKMLHPALAKLAADAALLWRGDPWSQRGLPHWHARGTEQSCSRVHLDSRPG